MSETLKNFDLFVQRKKRHRVSFSSELDHYLEEGIIPKTPNFNVLDWWKKYGPQIPTLQKIARDIYAITVSTVASESAFSMGGRLISPERNRLHPDLVEALACAQNCLKGELEGDTHFKTYCEDVDDEANFMVIEE